MVRQLMKDRIKAIHPFPYVDKCLPIADWNDPMWNPDGFDPSISEQVKIHYKNELQKLEEERIIINPTDQELLWAKQHSQWLYDKHEVDDSTEMQPTLLRIKSMKECLRLSQDGEIKSIERKMIKTSTLEKDTKGQSDAEEQRE